MKGERTWYSVLSTEYAILGATRLHFASFWLILAALAVPVAAAPPKLNHFFPAGVQRGQSVTVTAAGDFSTWPVQAWIDRPGLTLTAEKDKGKFTIAASTDAIPGTYWIRLYNGDG